MTTTTAMILCLIVVLLSLVRSNAKVYERCELARELKFVHETPGYQLATWVCIAEHESQYNTSALGRPNGDKSTDHGIFQINDRYWCSPPGKGHACGLPCSKFQDDDITDDYLCAQRIFKEHKHLSGDGFNAWAVYRPFCKGDKSEKYIKGCFNDEGGKSFPIETSTPGISSAVAHGFFGGIVGRGDDRVFSQTDKTISDYYYTPKTSAISYFTPSVRGSSFYTPTTPRSTIFPTSTTTTTIKPSVFSNPTTSRLIIFNPTTSTPSTFTIGSRSSIFYSPSTFFAPTSRSSSFFTSTTTPTVFHRSSAANSFVNEPVFIVNGVKWYK